MAREFGEYSPEVPLGVTWEEGLILEDEDGNPIDLAGYSVRAQFYLARPIRDPDTGVATVKPIAEITTAGYYSVLPTWPVIPGASVPTPTTQGLITSLVNVADVWTFSPTNVKQKYFWSIVLVNKDTGYAIPVVEGKPVFLPANTL